MIGNPFDRGDGRWQVVVNDVGQHALWRPFLEVPTGWRVVLHDADRDAALDYVERNWIDLQPAGPSKRREVR
ncbi:MbtH family protein [Salinispora fenicalii]|uniref:MbtH family protein n=1 Tax=Salinispora fenicalii TaxID=1137263 RepID=UPI0009EC4BEE|nr:MbtH family protein [Salinispora fenicalii]